METTTARVLRSPTESVLARFLRYVAIDSRSAEDVDTVPSTPAQWDIARLLVDELRDLGAQDIRLSDTCIVYAIIPANVDDPDTIAVIGLIANDPYTGKQVRIHPTTKKVVSPTGFPLTTFKVTSFRVITLL